MRKVIYIAGPYRGANAWEIEQNVRRAEEAALDVWRMGAVALCPHLNTRHFQGVLPDEVWLEGDKELLRRCDAVLAIPGWSQSAGARVEIKLAHDLGIPVCIDLQDVAEFIVRSRKNREEGKCQEAVQPQ